MKKAKRFQVESFISNLGHLILIVRICIKIENSEPRNTNEQLLI